MERSKIFSILSKFTKSEINEFRLFLKSPYFNKSTNIINLFNLLYPHHPGFISRVLNKDILHSKIYPESNFSSRSIDNLFTKLYKLCELFISVNNFKSDINEKNLILLTQFRKKNLDTLFLNKLKHLSNIYSSGRQYSPEQYDYYYKIHYFLIDYKFGSEYIEKKDELLNDFSENFRILKQYYYSHKIRLFIRLATIIYTTNPNREIGDNLKLLINDIYSDYSKSDHPAAHIFSEIAGSILNRKIFDFFRLKKELLKIQNIITTEDFDFILTLLTFYFFPFIDETDKILVHERFKHLKLLIERKVWNSAGVLMKEKNFSFVVYSAVMAGALEWAENFIKYNSIFVIQDQRNDAINYNMAFFYYAKAGADKFHSHEHYSKAFDYLSHFRIRDYTNKLQVYLLKSMLFFDTGEYDGMYSECKAFEQYILHHKKHISSQLAGSYIIYDKYLIHLTNYVIDEDYIKMHKLNEKIIKERPFINKAWLLERIKNFVSKRKI